MIKKLLAFVIIFLFIGASIVSSTSNIIEDVPANKITIESTMSYEEILSPYNNTIWYVYGGGAAMDTGFYAWGPGNITRFREWSGEFFSAGTWTNDGRWLCCMYGNGTLYEIDPKTFDAYVIGGGGTSLNALSYDPVTEKMYGVGSVAPYTDTIYEVDPYTGKQTELFELDYSGGLMICIAFDEEGVLYGWDLVQDTLWIIDLETEDVEEVGSLGINLDYAQDGDFHKESDRLFATAYTLSPWGSYLLEIDKETGEAELLGSLAGAVTTLAISYELNMMPPVTSISFVPVRTDCINAFYLGDVIVYLNATDNTGVIDTFYRINGEEWITYESPFIISEDEEYIIEYYSYDYVGNIEEVNICIYPENYPPDKPDRPSGPKSGKPGTEYIYTTKTTDINEDKIYFQWDWGDGTVSEWEGPYNTMEIAESRHTWEETGTYDVKVKAKDVHGEESDWSNPLSVTMPRDKMLHNTFFLQFFDRFPLIQHLFNVLRWYY